MDNAVHLKRWEKNTVMASSASFVWLHLHSNLVWSSLRLFFGQNSNLVQLLISFYPTTKYFYDTTNQTNNSSVFRKNMLIISDRSFCPSLSCMWGSFDSSRRHQIYSRSDRIVLRIHTHIPDVHTCSDYWTGKHERKLTPVRCNLTLLLPFAWHRSNGGSYEMDCFCNFVE